MNTLLEHPAPLVTDTGFYDTAHMERCRLNRYTDRLAERLGSGTDPWTTEDSFIRRLVEGRAVQEDFKNRPIPKYRTLVRLSDVVRLD